MANLKCTVVWMVFLLAHFDLEVVQSFPSLSFNISHCHDTYSSTCPPEPVPNDDCQNDQDCEARFPGQGLKCCSIDCLKKCVSCGEHVVKMTLKRWIPRTRLVAKCPTNPPSSESSPGPEQECQNDGVCDSKFPGQGLKCCSDGCDFRCIPPVVESFPPFIDSGTCPVFPKPGYECPPEPDNECTNDWHCQQLHPGLDLKCCEDGCDLRCVPLIAPPTDIFLLQSPTRALTAVSGTCPVFPEGVDCPPEPDNECTNDWHCQQLHPGVGLKCCVDGCDLRCIPPIAPPADISLLQPTPAFTVNGTCPAAPESPPRLCSPKPDDDCKYDWHCWRKHPGWRLKCCKDVCDSLRCRTPIPPTFG